ncbi:biotin synthase BioB [bacterium]|nr:biotin synthase BioB [bacterium]MBU1152680.1 biotin synthase BioB [bacterium]
MIDERLTKIALLVIKGLDLGIDDALYLTQAPLFELLFWANYLREKFKDKKIDTCSIINAKSGKCSEDCKFCAQSALYQTQILTHPLVEEKKILAEAHQAKLDGAKRFGIVTSGRKLNSKEIERVCQAIKSLNQEGEILPCASLGKLTLEYIHFLKEVGLKRYHHNLETSEDFFSKLCLSHSHAERVETIKLVKEAGLEVCSGGIFGVGETWQDRINVAFKLRELRVDSIPLNFLNPISGTPLSSIERIAPFEILRIIALFRFIHPQRDIRLGGGRDVNLRDLQAWMYYAGANGVMIGNYLTTSGRPPEEDLRFIKDFELEVGLERKD